jgi:DNA-binding response OmpR family regulator
MPVTRILTIGLDFHRLSARCANWKSANYTIASADSIPEAINHIKASDFDLVLLGDLISRESMERLAFLIQITDSTIPVLRLTDFIAEDTDNVTSFDAGFERYESRRRELSQKTVLSDQPSTCY